MHELYEFDGVAKLFDESRYSMPMSQSSSPTENFLLGDFFHFFEEIEEHVEKDTMPELQQTKDKNVRKLLFASSSGKDNSKTREDGSCERKVKDQLYEIYNTKLAGKNVTYDGEKIVTTDGLNFLLAVEHYIIKDQNGDEGIQTTEIIVETCTLVSL